MSKCSCHKQIKPVVLVHGGAGALGRSSFAAKNKGTKLAAHIGYVTLKHTGSVLDAVQEAVKSFESDPEFNAGNGAVLTMDGTIEMDAAIMDGATLNAGCVSQARDICHPIMLARAVMEKTGHKFLAGEGAMRFAFQQGFRELPEGALMTPKSVKALEEYKDSLRGKDSTRVFSQPQGLDFGESDTVGAVAIDCNGNMAAATSTGGLTGKLPGRIGDSPILGCGTYADNDAGCTSATGHGETIMRYTVASRVLAQMSLNDLSAQQASEKVLNDMTRRFKQTGGVITIDSKGGLGIYFTTRHMPWAYQRGKKVHYGLCKGENIVEYFDDSKSVPE